MHSCKIACQYRWAPIVQTTKQWLEHVYVTLYWKQFSQVTLLMLKTNTTYALYWIYCKCIRSSKLRIVWNLGSAFKGAVWEQSFIPLLNVWLFKIERRTAKQLLLKSLRTQGQVYIRLSFFLWQCCYNNNNAQHHLVSKKLKTVIISYIMTTSAYYTKKTL